MSYLKYGRSVIQFILFLGFIQVTNTSITLKGEDGSDIKLALLKKPIPIDDLIYEPTVGDDKSPVERSKKTMLCDLTNTEGNIIHDYSDDKPPLTFLKEPISLDDIGDGKELSLLNEKPSYVGSIGTRPSRRNVSQVNQTWKRNALTLFEFTYVYPFVHAGNKFKCYVCSKPFIDANALRQHSINDHTIEELKLEMNKKVRDKILKVDVVQLQCKLCQGMLPTLSSLKVHLRDHGKQIDPEYQDNIIPFKLGGETFDCHFCGESFQRLRLLIIHMSKHFNN